MLIQLPNGLIDGADLFNYAEIDELRGKQQNYLADTGLIVGNIGHVPKIVNDLVKSLQTKEGLVWKGDLKSLTQKLPASDLETILIKIRENTYGPKFFHEAVCTHCEHRNKNLRLDLDKLELFPMSVAAMMDTASRTFTLPKSGAVVELKPIYLKDLTDIIKATQNKGSELITSLSVTAIKRLGDKSPVSPKDIENLPAKDIYFIQEKLKEIEVDGHIDTTIETTCSNCEKDFSMKLNVYDPDFFDPSKDTAN